MSNIKLLIFFQKKGLTFLLKYVKVCVNFLGIACMNWIIENPCIIWFLFDFD